MLKALIKKQFLELNSAFFLNKKTGDRRSKAGLIGMTAIYALLFIALGISFFGVSDMLAKPLMALNLDWLFFCMMGLVAIALGTFGSVFNTYAGLYNAKDNDLLLSMPIPPSKILFARLTGVYLMSLLYTSLVWIPAFIRYLTIAPPPVLTVIFCILQTFVLSFFVTVLTCILGWVVALISSKVKSKSFVTVLVSIAFIAVYYFVYFRINEFLQGLVSNAEAIGGKIKSVFYPFYLMGLAASGKVLPMLAVTAIVAVLFALAYYVLSRSFIKIATTKTAEKKAEFKSSQIKSTSFSKALLKKELKRFTSSPVYMLNSGLGTVLSIVLPIIAIVKAEMIRQYLDLFSLMFSENISDLFPIVAACVVCMMLSMNQITAPSISLEGRSIWVLQSLPVDPKDVFTAKIRLHMLLNLPGTVIASAGLGYVIKADFNDIIYMVLFCVSYILFSASLGLFLNLKNPNLTWTSETVPVKQSSAVGISLFGGWAIAAATGLIGYLLYNKISLDYYLMACALILIFATRFLNKYLYTKGTEIFRSL